MTSGIRAATPPSVAPSGHRDAPGSDLYRPDIDGLRGLAVMLVVAYHFFPSAVRSGFIGVDIFFVISGYLISSHLFTQLLAGQCSLLDFYQRRVVRLLPTLLLVLLACLAFGWLNLLPAQFKELGKHTAGGAGFIANFLLWKEAGYFGGDAALKPLLHLWSLAIEEQFYLVWPVFLLLIMRKPRTWNVLVPAMLFILIVASYASSAWAMHWDKSAAFYWPATRFWELMLGAGLAYVQRRWPPLATTRSAWCNHALTSLGLLLLLVAVVRINPQRNFPGTWVLLPTVGTALLIAAGPRAWVNRLLLAPAPLRWPGLISYAWYLWHWPLIAFAHLELGEGLPKTWILGLLLASLLLATATTWFVERPLRFHAFWRKHRAKLSVTLVSMLLLVGYAGYNIYDRDGLAFRLPTMIRKMTEPPVDMFAGWGRGSCLLESHQAPDAYAPECIEARRPLVFVWGDSHAAALMPGLKVARDALPANQAFGLAQRTGATCPPFTFVPDPHCNAMNHNAMAQIRSLRPEVVLLHAFWTFDFYDLSQLTPTIAFLQQAGVGRIVVLGAPPGWQPPLPLQVLKAWEAGPPSRTAPFRLKDGVMPATFEREIQTLKLANAAGAETISMVDLLCTPEGCQTRETPSSDHLISHDYGHLSYEAAVWMAQAIIARLRRK